MPLVIRIRREILDWLSAEALHSLQQECCGLLVKHARYYWLWLAEGHLTRRLFGAIVRRIAALPVPGG